MNINKEKIVFSVLLLGVGVAYRFLPHPPNFSPVAAIALFGGFYYRRMWSAFIPVIILFISDFFLGFYQLPIMLSVYLSFLLITFLGKIIKRKKSMLVILGSSLTGSILFFLITNFAVWFFSNWYPHNISGLADCFWLALPFFRNTLLGDLFYVSVFFGAYEFSLAYTLKRNWANPDFKNVLR